jgi:hypothetical protein
LFRDIGYISMDLQILFVEDDPRLKPFCLLPTIEKLIFWASESWTIFSPRCLFYGCFLGPARTGRLFSLGILHLLGGPIK